LKPVQGKAVVEAIHSATVSAFTSSTDVQILCARPTGLIAGPAGKP